MLDIEDLVLYRKSFYHRKRQAEQSRRYWKEHPEKLRKRNASRVQTGGSTFNKWKYRNPEKTILSAAKHRAKSRGLEFNLTVEDIVIPDVCPVLGIPIHFMTKCFGDNSPSLDRIDNTKGYVRGNVAVISNRANRLKCDGLAEDFRKIADYIERNNPICVGSTSML